MKAPDEVSAMLWPKALGFFGQIHEGELNAWQESDRDGCGISRDAMLRLLACALTRRFRS